MTKKSFLIHWLVICAIPLFTLLAFQLFPPPDFTQYLINGIILACEATFLFKYVLFEIVKFHLKHDTAAKKQALTFLIPIFVLIVYLFHYFIGFSHLFVLF